MAKKKKIAVPEESRLPIEWTSMGDVDSRYSNNMIIQHTDNEFIISFFEVMPPLIVRDPDMKGKKVDEPSHATASCVARIIVNPDKVKSLIDALQTNYETYKQRVTAGGSKKEGE